jgi:hypothetical protein
VDTEIKNSLFLLGDNQLLYVAGHNVVVLKMGAIGDKTN